MGKSASQNPQCGTENLEYWIQSLENDAALKNAPQRHDEYFKVPKILDDASGA